MFLRFFKHFPTITKEEKHFPREAQKSRSEGKSIFHIFWLLIFTETAKIFVTNFLVALFI